MEDDPVRRFKERWLKRFKEFWNKPSGRIHIGDGVDEETGRYVRYYTELTRWENLLIWMGSAAFAFVICAILVPLLLLLLKL